MVHTLGRSASQTCQPLPATDPPSRLGVNALQPAIKDNVSVREKKTDRLTRIALL